MHNVMLPARSTSKCYPKKESLVLLASNEELSQKHYESHLFGVFVMVLTEYLGRSSEPDFDLKTKQTKD